MIKYDHPKKNCRVFNHIYDKFYKCSNIFRDRGLMFFAANKLMWFCLFKVKSEKLEKVRSVFGEYERVKKQGSLLQIEFTTLHDYLHLLRGNGVNT